MTGDHFVATLCRLDVFLLFTFLNIISNSRIEFNCKIESGTLSASSHYTPLTEGVEFYEKKVKGKRYTVKDKPLTLGYYGILDNLDNCIIECYPTKEEAEKEAEILNGFTDGNGRLKTVI